MAAPDPVRRGEEADLLRMVTVGSVDDGKSTLIGRMLHESQSIMEDELAAVRGASDRMGREEADLALLIDGLKAEREQGITIDVAYRHFRTPGRRFIIADCPGHEQYTRNMVTGASTADLAVLLIDARLGVLTQSKRHAFIASLLGVPHMVVAVNKMDTVDYSQEVYERIVADYGSFAARLRIKDLTYVPVSALKGDNVVERSARIPWYGGPSLLDHLQKVYVASDRNLVDLRLPVQLVLRPGPEFRGYAGRLASGVLRVGDEVMVLPSGRTSRIASVSAAGREVEYAFPPQSVVVTLEDHVDVSRGDMLAHRANLPGVRSELEAIIVWMDTESFRPGRQYLVKHAAGTVRGKFSKLHYRIDPDELHREKAAGLELNEIGRVDVELLRPIACDEYTRNRATGTGSFIVIDPDSNATAAAGMIIERAGRRRSRSAGATSAPVSRNITRQRGLVGGEDRAGLLGQNPVTVWLTGLSSSGKSTVAFALERRLVDEGRAYYVLDGDNVRHGLNRDLGFSAEDRAENIRRVAETARLFNDAGVILITAFISPYRDDRRAAREIVGEGSFVEVFVDAPLEVCESRDPKGLYRKARAGEISEFTGVSAPYEAPEDPEVHVPTDQLTVDEAVDRIIGFLRGEGVFR